MSQLGKYLRKMEGGYGHWCPGCKTMHYIAVEKPLGNGAKWTFDGNIEAPTFNPSVSIKIPWAEDPEACHYFLHGGQIKFCGDSTHALAGQTIPLPEWPSSVKSLTPTGERE